MVRGNVLVDVAGMVHMDTAWEDVWSLICLFILTLKEAVPLIVGGLHHMASFLLIRLIRKLQPRRPCSQPDQVWPPGKLQQDGGRGDVKRSKSKVKKYGGGEKLKVKSDKMVAGKKYDSNTNLVEAMEPTALDDEKTKPKFHKSSSMAKQSSIVGTRVAMIKCICTCFCRLSQIWFVEKSFLQLCYSAHHQQIPSEFVPTMLFQIWFH